MEPGLKVAPTGSSEIVACKHNQSHFIASGLFSIQTQRRAQAKECRQYMPGRIQDEPTDLPTISTYMIRDKKHEERINMRWGRVGDIVSNFGGGGDNGGVDTAGVIVESRHGA